MVEKPPLKVLSPQDWENLIDDFQYGGARREKWCSSYPFTSLSDLAIGTLLKKDYFPTKLHILVFLDEFASDPLLSQSIELQKLVDTLWVVVQAHIDGVSVTYSLKEQMMVSVTSIVITFSTDLEMSNYRAEVESLIELLLTVINRPNHGPDRQARAVACECLRELEKAFPGLLSEIAGHLWVLCQGERTHASQSYLLLFGSVIHNIVARKLSLSILNTSIPLVPFNVPQWMGNGKDVTFSGLNYKELRRAMAFLLEGCRVLTPCGMVEFVAVIIPLALMLELQASMLKVQFFGIIYSYDPMLCHVILMMYWRLPDALDGQEGEIYRRLMSISREVQNQVFFRLLSMHWLLGFVKLLSDRDIRKKKLVFESGLRLYPVVFDPLSLKALKLDFIVLFSTSLDSMRSEKNGGECVSVEERGSELSVVELFEDGIVCVSGFKWLPPGSTETAIAFRTFHKFLIGASSHSDTDSSTNKILMESKIFHAIKCMLVDMTLEFRRLVPVIVAFIDRLLGCHTHNCLGVRLLQTFDEHFLFKVAINHNLASYFPIFDRIAENDTIPPSRLTDLLTDFMIFLVKKHGPDTLLKSWSNGSHVLGTCQKMLVNHHSSRLFIRLSRLLAFTCLHFPDLEVRDNARIYLRMLICIPGKKLRGILKSGEQLAGISPSSHTTSFFNVQSPQASRGLKNSVNLSSYIFLERVIPLLVKQCWSLTLPILSDGYADPGGIRDRETLCRNELVGSDTVGYFTETAKIDYPNEPLRVIDKKTAEVVGVLRRHFSCIPDFRHMPGLKIRIDCSLRFKSELSSHIWETELPFSCLDGNHGIDKLPAIYATVLKFSSSSPYGSIPPCHIPFLLGEPPKNASSAHIDTLDIVSVAEVSQLVGSFKAPVAVELEPREPVPGLVDVSIETNSENGQIICGELQSVAVGIEDMFLKAIVPADVSEDATPAYLADLFSALWEACETSSGTGRETFALKGGKGVAAIGGTQSVKLLEVRSSFFVRVIEGRLGPFVVRVMGKTLIEIVKDNGVIKDIMWKELASDFVPSAPTSLDAYSGGGGPLCLKYTDDDDDDDRDSSHIRKKNIGCFDILIFLPPRYHLLFQMEVCEESTLARIKTDHWPCLAYIDDYLEALFLA